MLWLVVGLLDNFNFFHMFPSLNKRFCGLVFRYGIKNNKISKAIFGFTIFNAKKSILTKQNQFNLNQFLVHFESYSQEIVSFDLVGFFNPNQAN
jgi:hypothetical protein